MIMMMSHLLPSLELSVLGTIKPLATKASTLEHYLFASLDWEARP